MMGMLGISDEGTREEQRKSILSVMGQTKIDLDKYIYDNLSEETTFYIIEKEFWKSWSEVHDKFQEKVE